MNKIKHDVIKTEHASFSTHLHKSVTNICDGQSAKVHKQYMDVRGRSKILKGLEQRSLHKHSV